MRAESQPGAGADILWPMEARPILLAFGVLLAGLVVGAVMMAIDRPMLGMLLGFSAVPIALVVWMTAGER